MHLTECAFQLPAFFQWGRKGFGGSVGGDLAMFGAALRPNRLTEIGRAVARPVFRRAPLHCATGACMVPSREVRI